MKQVDFFGTQVSRLILGDNSMVGLSYIPRQYKSVDMLNYWTAENCVSALFEAERNGINTFMAVADPFILRVIREYKNQGGTMHIMFQTYPPIDLNVNIVQMKPFNPITVYHQGTTADIWLEEGKVDFLRERIERLRAMGLPTGLATHDPEIMFRAEEENWGIDFYMASLQNPRKYAKEESTFLTGKEKETEFHLEDRAVMLEAIRKISKPCIVFKIFAGGQMFYDREPEEIPGLIKGSMEEVFGWIKGGDIVLIGAFQKDSNQIKENVDIANSLS